MPPTSFRTSRYDLFSTLCHLAVGCFILLFVNTPGVAQGAPMYDYTVRDPMAPVATDHWLRPADSFDRGRFFGATGVGLALYGATSFGLYHAWYANFERRGLRSFDDWPEWNQMDKAGHVFSAYTFNRYAFAGLRWAGLRRSHSRIAALGVANLLQGTIELMDGYSAGWGFSWSDMGANVAGSLVFTLQDVAWREQRILLKVSNDLRPHPDVPVFNEAREGNLGFVTRQRFGQGHLERFLKDYNAQTIWASVNPKSFFPRSKLPGWLNVAVGYGSENVYGAYGNVWREDGVRFLYPEDRYRQYFLSPDIYLSRIPTKKRWVRLVLGALDAFKIPGPALEYGDGSFKWHWFMW